MFKKVILFLILNFSALAIGGLFTGNGVSSEWYQNLNQAPWNPPGWMFGFMWTLIMICFAVYMAYLIKAKRTSKKIILLFGIQWLLNVAWNPVFFYYKLPILALIIISVLALLISYFLLNYTKTLKLMSLFIVPYFIWIIIATSLNAYIVFFN